MEGRIPKWPPIFPPLLNLPSVIPSFEFEQDMPVNMMGYHSHDYVVLYVKRDFIDGIKVPSQLTLS